MSTDCGDIAHRAPGSLEPLSAASEYSLAMGYTFQAFVLHVIWKMHVSDVVVDSGLNFCS